MMTGSTSSRGVQITMTMHWKTAPALAVLTLSAVGVGLAGFQAQPGAKAKNDSLKTEAADGAAAPAKPDTRPSQPTPNPAAWSDKGLDRVQDRITGELTRLRTQQQ